MQHTPPYDWLHEFMLQSRKCLAWCLLYIYLSIKPYKHACSGSTDADEIYCNLYRFWCCWNKKAKHIHLCFEHSQKKRSQRYFCGSVPAVCQDFDAMWNEYFMSYETHRIVCFPLPLWLWHSSPLDVCVLIKSAQLKTTRSFRTEISEIPLSEVLEIFSCVFSETNPLERESVFDSDKRHPKSEDEENQWIFYRRRS